MTDPVPGPEFLDSCDVIDFHSSDVAELATELNGGEAMATAQDCFEFVRDNIRHSADYQSNPVTCRASDVLAHRTGFCYAKSHLLCALLRANDIPAGLCYQRLTISNEQPPFSLHGLVAAYLPEIGWYRIDPRGNRDGIDAQFDPPNERLAFSTNLPGERDYADIHVSPLPEVVQCLRSCGTWDEVAANLPDANADFIDSPWRLREKT